MKAGRALRVLVSIGAIVPGMSAGLAQVESSEERSTLPQALFVDAISVAGGAPGEGRLDVFVQMNYEGLTFVKHGSSYDASYEITVTISDSAGTAVGEKNWMEEVKGLTFEQSVSASASSIVQRVFPVKPGVYKITVNTVDGESKVGRTISRQIGVPVYPSDRFMLSDVLLLSKVTQVGDKRSIQPQVAANVGNIPVPLHVFFEAYNPTKLDSVRYTIAAMTAKGELVRSQDTVIGLAPGRNDQILQFNHSTLPLGDYRLFIQAFRRQANDTVGAEIGNTSRTIVVRWWGLPRSVKDLDLAIDQVRYIAKEGEMGPMEDAKTPEEKQAKFLEFWKRRDPNPNTPRNEKMELYYSRVEYANRHFTHYREGWRTDMGMIYIIFGPPNDVSRHPFEVDSKPYELWRYYDLNYDFVFIDESGFGDYRLINPLYDLRKRPSDW